MATIAELLVRLGADPQRFIQGIQSASESFDNFVFRVDQSSQALRSIGLASAAAGTAMLGFAAIAVTAAAQAQREQTLLAQAIEATGRAAEFSVEALNKQARALERITPFSDEAVTSVQRLLVGFQLTQAEIETLTPRVLDITARLGIDLTTSALAVGRAFTFGVTGLRRLGVALDDTADPIQNFAGFIEQIDRASAGAAEELGTTFVGALARFRNQAENVLEAIGAPLLGPLTALANLAARGAEAVRFLAEGMPNATRAIVFLTVALGVFLVGAGGLASLLSLLPRANALVAAWSGAFGTLFGAVVRATLGLRGFLLGTQAVNRQLALLPGVTLAAAGAIARLPGLLALAAGAARVFGVAIRGLAGGVIGIVAFELAFRLLGAVIDRVGPKVRQFLEFLGLVAPSQKDAEEAAAGLNAALRRQGQTLEQVEANYKEAKAASDLFSASTRRAAAESARLKLLSPGIDEAGVKATLERLEQAQRDAQIGAAANSLEIERRRVDQLLKIQEGFARRRRGGLATDVDAEKQVADQIIEARKNISDAEDAITAARLESAKVTAAAITAAEETARDARVGAERAVRDAAQAIGQQRLEAERDRIRAAEGLRLDALRRVADLERTLSEAVFAARDALARAAAAREDQTLRERATERVRLVREGFLEESEAERQAQLDRFEQQKAGIEREIALRAQRGAEARRQADAELAVAAAQFQAEQAIRQADLSASIAIGRAETRAKIVELQAQFAARKAELLAEVAARRAAGVLSEEEAAARAAQIRAIEAGTQAQIGALLEGQAGKERALTEASVAVRLGAERGLAAELQAIQARQAQAQAEGASDVVEQTTRLAALIAERREELREQGLSPGEIDRQLRPAEILLSQQERAAQVAGKAATESLAKVEAGLKKVADALAEVVARLVAGIERLADPANLLAGLDRIGRAVLPLPPGGPPAVAGAAAGAAPGLVVNLGDVQLRLEGDEAALAARVIGRLLGPEGNRLIEDYFKRTPGPRPGAL